MSNKLIISILFITSAYSYGAPTNKTEPSPYFTLNKTANPNSFTPSVLQPIQKHPIKTTVTGIVTLYGLKLVFEGSKTRNITPNKLIKGNWSFYDIIGVGTQVVGVLVITAGASVLYQIFSETDNSDTTDTTKKTIE